MCEVNEELEAMPASDNVLFIHLEVLESYCKTSSSEIDVICVLLKSPTLKLTFPTAVVTNCVVAI